MRTANGFSEYLSFVATFAPCVTGKAKWDKPVPAMEQVIKGKLSFEKVFSASDEAFLLICMDNYRKRWLEEFAHAVQMETRNVWGQKRAPDVLVSYSVAECPFWFPN